MKSVNCCNTESVPTLAVGILSAPKIRIRLLSGFGARSGAIIEINAAGLNAQGGKIEIKSAAGEMGVFEVEDVTIGIGFHWERRETQRFTGEIEMLADGDNAVLINHVDIESYLKSVISSEMSPTASQALLRSHAVISRSWVLSQIRRRGAKCAPKKPSGCEAVDEIIRWYDRDDHLLFDVCADDHCQRYQGITRQTVDAASEAVEATRGQILTCQGEICDARFSKCCGGMMEEFDACWENTSHPYLQARLDSAADMDPNSLSPIPDLRDEATMRQWIEAPPTDSFCRCDDAATLSQVLNNYDRETPDFYRWKLTYSQEELSALIRRKSGIDFDRILRLEPIERGRSGRIIRLKIVGEKRTLTVGKELEIRRWLSPSHLYSSAFIVDYGPTDAEGIPATITLRGAGWGHGVGLCQIGAAVMGARGYDYRTILAHYYPQSQITDNYGI